MEENFAIPTPDGKRLYGVLHRPVAETSSAVILVHGLTGNMHEYSHLTFARYLVKMGVAVVRFNQYDDKESARRFHETTIRLHVEDTRTVVAFARARGYERVGLVGHSLGGPVVISACDSETRAIVLWDPTATPSERLKDWVTRETPGGHPFLDWQIRMDLGEEWIEDAKSFPDAFNRISELIVPIKIIAAEKGEKLPFCERYRAGLKSSDEYVVVPHAGHTFVEEGAIERLSTETASWLLTHLHTGRQ